MDKDPERVRDEKFVAALNELCKEHGRKITLGCGCCGGSDLVGHPTDRPAYKIESDGYIAEAS